MFPCTKDRNEGTFRYQNRDERTFGCSPVPKGGANAHSPKPSLKKKESVEKVPNPVLPILVFFAFSLFFLAPKKQYLLAIYGWEHDLGPNFREKQQKNKDSLFLGPFFAGSCG